MISLSQRAVLAVVSVVAALTAAVPTATADDLLYSVKIGGLWHDTPGLWSGFQAENDAVDINVEAQLAMAYAMPWGGSIRPVIGGTINTQGDTSHAYIDARWQIDGPSGLFFGLGLGAAVHDGEIGGISADPSKKWLGSRVLFHIPAEVGLRAWRRSDVRNRPVSDEAV